MAEVNASDMSNIILELIKEKDVLPTETTPDELKNSSDKINAPEELCTNPMNFKDIKPVASVSESSQAVMEYEKDLLLEPYSFVEKIRYKLLGKILKTILNSLQMPYLALCHMSRIHCVVQIKY